MSPITMVLLLGAATSLSAQTTRSGSTTQRVDTVVVEGRSDTLLEVADSANEGRVDSEEIRRRPMLRVGEVMETVPGLIATQHSGAGKGNQFFLRGFNLDHGTDLATRIAGMPANMPSHGHGQGYTDLNFLIPELVDAVRFRKGPYTARDGNFASAGAVDIDYKRSLDAGYFRAEVGSFDHLRSLFADSVPLGEGHLLYAAEALHRDGPWQNPDDLSKFNGLAQFSTGDASNGLRVALMGYHGRWTATDQIPRRARNNGVVGRFGTLDPTDGGEAERYSLSAEWARSDSRTATRILAFGISSEFDLYSNFTYFLDDPVNGDQLHQTDKRVVLGTDIAQTWFGSLAQATTENTIGLQVRSDTIQNGLHSTTARRRLSTVRRDDIQETSLGVYLENRTQWTEKLRSVASLRGDVFVFDVDSDNDFNSGSKVEGVFSPRASVAAGPCWNTEIYVNGGFGFHSNDARGVTLQDDPTTPAPNDGSSVTPLARTFGTEFGVRTTALPGLQSTLSLWYLRSDSELIFVGDAGNTEASRPSHRHGLELANDYRPWPWLHLDLDLSLSRSRFRDVDPAGSRVPNSIETAIHAGLTYEDDDLLASIRMRHLGSRPLSEDNSVRSSSTTLFNALLGCRTSDKTSVSLGIFNLFDAGDSDIEYFYGSRLAGEPAAGIDDIHFHPVEPLSFRLIFEARF